MASRGNVVTYKIIYMIFFLLKKTSEISCILFLCIKTKHIMSSLSILFSNVCVKIGILYNWYCFRGHYWMTSE